MSARNSQANKAAARERLRQERERQAKRDKRKRQITVAVSVVAALALAGGIGYAVVQANKPSQWEAAKSVEDVKAPRNTSGENGTTVVIGKPTAKKTLQVFEDARCPVCAIFEQQIGPVIEKDVEAGKYKIQYVGATFIDEAALGEGSKNALSALGAALDVSPDAFMKFKAAMYSAKFHPEESKDEFAKDSYILKIADTVPELKDNAEFEKNVEEGTFDAWALKMSAFFDKSGVTGTPSLKMDGKPVTGANGKNAPMTAPEFTTAIDKALKG
ncbi:thioredoxin domain-containing protein [Streptomyces sudanensis]|uniref:thioredoxin domain-containing protein n=1 Tax=Streptomyces sudanensis TaxID=436397 RepID=UPI0020CDAEA6|nr:thioredoxin domain-containing protein [Streptomyces sudanensis]MCP9959336.1 DsbA family protein [Streptomyces sudanensis]MCP9988412.1 DsbA family protein [Streptomyces sudanensis]MCQ0000205.1 DsbA family protein [Streptomyces sudanensis]